MRFAVLFDGIKNIPKEHFQDNFLEYLSKVPIQTCSEEKKIILLHSRFKFLKKDEEKNEDGKQIEEEIDDDDQSLLPLDEKSSKSDFYNNVYIPWGPKYDFSYLIQHIKKRKLNFFFSFLEFLGSCASDLHILKQKENRRNNICFTQDLLESLYLIFVQQK